MDYSRQGVDQLADVILNLENNAYARRITMSAWNPAARAEMALLPCHTFAQFYVWQNEGNIKGALSCVSYYEICDMGFGVPFNIASYALLTILIAHVCGLEAGDHIHTTGDAHLYADHADVLKVQLVSAPRDFPTLKINRQVDDLDDLKFRDFELVGYDPRPSIKMNMCV